MKDLFKEWEELINELSEKEITHFKMKNDLEEKKNDIILNTDFKKLYGKNNEDIRKAHLKKETGLLSDKIKDLEFDISYIKRRIKFLENITKFYSKE